MYRRKTLTGSPDPIGATGRIKPCTGMFLSQDEYFRDVETEEELEKPEFKFTGETKEALKNYYDAAHELCAAQTGFAKATQELESKVKDKTVFLSIIQQVRLPSVQIHVRTVEEIEQLEGKTYRELTINTCQTLGGSTTMQQTKPGRWQLSCTLSCTNRSLT